MGLGSVVVVRGGLRVIVGGGAVLVVGGAYVVLGPGIGGKGSIAVCCLTASLAMTSATTNPMTSSTAAPATNHSHRGDRGRRGATRTVVHPSADGPAASTGAATVGWGWLGRRPAPTAEPPPP